MLEIDKIKDEIRLEERRIAEMVALLQTEEDKLNVNLPIANQNNTELIKQRNRNDELQEYLVCFSLEQLNIAGISEAQSSNRY